MDHPPAVVLISAALAAAIAVRSINQQRATTRLRETFTSRHASNWDRDVIDARKVFGELKEELRPNPQEIAKYAYPVKAEKLEENFVTVQDKHDEIAGTLRTILNDYENTALGIRLNILDEDYLFKLIRGTMLRDWHFLSPLVTAYRHRLDSQLVYIEYEGLTNAWLQNISYRTGTALQRTTRFTFFR